MGDFPILGGRVFLTFGFGVFSMDDDGVFSTGVSTRRYFSRDVSGPGAMI
jgi:hypothetical protein